MAQSAKAQEPSMEEILASIRRIIADDEGKPQPARAPEAVVAKPAPMPRSAPPPPPPRPVAAPPPPPQPRPAAPPPPPPRPAPPPMPPAAEIDSLIAASEPRGNGAAPPAPPSDVLDLTEAMATPAPTNGIAGFRTIDGQPDVIFSEAPEPPSRDEAPAPEASGERLLSGSASAAVDSAFSSLAQTVLVHNARTLEDLVREMLRPLLKTWLDDNLPGLVERLVRAEIERVSRGRT